MPRVTPSLIVEAIDSSFAELAERGTIGTLDEGHLPAVSTLVALVDRLDENALAALAAAQYRDLAVALEHLRAAVSRWHNPPTPGGPRMLVSARPALGNRHPVAVIRDLMRGLPEEPVAVAQRRLGFLGDPDLEQSIATDVTSAEAAQADGRLKNSCVMAGAAIEALLLWAVQRRQQADHQRAYAQAQARRQTQGRQPLGALDNDPRRWGLEQYIEVARELPVLSGDPADACFLAKDFRNLIHPGRAERLQKKATRGSAAQGLAALSLTIEDLAARNAAGQL